MQFLSSESSVPPDGHSTLSTDASTRSESPTTSHETVCSIEECSSIHSFTGRFMHILLFQYV